MTHHSHRAVPIPQRVKPYAPPPPCLHQGAASAQEADIRSALSLITASKDATSRSARQGARASGSITTALHASGAAAVAAGPLCYSLNAAGPLLQPPLQLSNPVMQRATATYWPGATATVSPRYILSAPPSSLAPPPRYSSGAPSSLGLPPSQRDSDAATAISRTYGSPAVAARRPGAASADATRRAAEAGGVHHLQPHSLPATWQQQQYSAEMRGGNPATSSQGHGGSIGSGGWVGGGPSGSGGGGAASVLGQGVVDRLHNILTYTRAESYAMPGGTNAYVVPGGTSAHAYTGRAGGAAGAGAEAGGRSGERDRELGRSRR